MIRTGLRRRRTGQAAIANDHTVTRRPKGLTVFRQYYAQRCRGGSNPLRVGVIPIGAIYYLQDDWWWRDRHRGKPICREPWMMTAFLNGIMGASRRNRETGQWESTYQSGRSDMALVRSLRDGRLQRIAVRTLQLHEDEGLWREPAGYPSLPVPSQAMLADMAALDRAAANSLAQRRASGQIMTYESDGWVVREYPGGRIERLARAGEFRVADHPYPGFTPPPPKR